MEEMDLGGYVVNVEKLQRIASAIKTVVGSQQWLRVLARSSMVLSSAIYLYHQFQVCQ